MLRRIFGSKTERSTLTRNLGDYASKRVPWWCMDGKHQPYYSEDAYDAHMLEVHRIDVRRSYQNKVRTDIRT